MSYLLLVPAVVVAGAPARGRAVVRQDDARRLLPHRRPSPARRSRSTASSPTAPWPGSRTAADRRDRISAPTSSRSRRRERHADLLARLRVALRRVGDDRRGDAGAPHLPRVAALPLAGRPGAGRAQEARSARTRSAESGRRRSTPLAVRQPRAAARRREGVERRSRTARPSEKVDLLILGEGYTAAELREVPRATCKRLTDTLFAAEPFQSRRGGLQRAGDRPAVGGERRQPAARRQVPAHAAVGRVLRLRLRALHAHLRQPRAPRRRRRRRPTSSSRSSPTSETYGGGGIFNFTRRSPWTPPSPSTSSSTSSATTSRRWPTSTTPRRRLRAGAERQPEPWEPNVTALRDPATLKWRDLVDAGHAAADAVAEGGVRGDSADIQARRARDPRAQRARRRRWTRCSARSRRSRTQLLARRAARRHRSAPSRAPTTRRSGFYRPQTDCIMFTRDRVGFCAVCQRAHRDDHRSVSR